MALTLSRCAPEDAEELANVYVAVFSRPPLRQVMFEHCSQQEVLNSIKETLRAGLEEQRTPSLREEWHFLKMTDDATNEIVAFAVWKYLPNGYKIENDPQARTSKAPMGANEDLLETFARKTGEVRSSDPGRRGPHWLLSLLGTHPGHERRGAASRLSRWPFERADRGQTCCYVDASILGYSMYKRCGFAHDVGEMEIDLDEYDARRRFGLQRWTAMMRRPNSL